MEVTVFCQDAFAVLFIINSFFTVCCAPSGTASRHHGLSKRFAQVLPLLSCRYVQRYRCFTLFITHSDVKRFSLMLRQPTSSSARGESRRINIQQQFIATVILTKAILKNTILIQETLDQTASLDTIRFRSGRDVSRFPFSPWNCCNDQMPSAVCVDQHHFRLN